MSSRTEQVRLVFTSYRGSIGTVGLKVSLDKHAPKLCAYPTLNFLIIPSPRSLTTTNMKRICNAILHNNWDLIHDFIDDMYSLGLHKITFCCWCTVEQIEQGKFCPAGIIGRYIEDKANNDGSFEFPIEIEYGDGREAL